MMARTCLVVCGVVLIGTACGAPLTARSTPTTATTTTVSTEPTELETPQPSESVPLTTQSVTTIVQIPPPTVAPSREVSTVLFVNGVQVSPTSFCLPDPNSGGGMLCGDNFFASPTPVGVTEGPVTLEFPMTDWTISVRLADNSVEFPTTVVSPGVWSFDLSGLDGTIEIRVSADGQEGDAGYLLQITVIDPSVTTLPVVKSPPAAPTPTVSALPGTQ